MTSQDKQRHLADENRRSSPQQNNGSDKAAPVRKTRLQESFAAPGITSTHGSAWGSPR
jgi:hypothetical protein